MRTGVLYLLSFVILGSAQDVFLATFFQSNDPFVTVFGSFSISALVFLATLYGKRQKAWKHLREHGKIFFILNCGTALNWFCFFWSLKYLEPVVSGAISFSFLPAISILLGPWLRPQQKISFFQKMSAVGILASLSLLIAGVFWGSVTTVLKAKPSDALLGVLLCILTSLGMSTNAYFTKKIHERGCSSHEIMAFRFLLLVLGSGLVVTAQDKLSFYGEPRFQLQILFIAVTAVVLPMTLLQKGLEQSSPLTSSILLALTPGTTLIFQALEGRLPPPISSISGALLCCFFAWVGVVKQKGSRTQIGH